MWSCIRLSYVGNSDGFRSDAYNTYNTAAQSGGATGTTRLPRHAPSAAPSAVISSYTSLGGQWWWTCV